MSVHQPEAGVASVPFTSCDQSRTVFEAILRLPFAACKDLLKRFLTADPEKRITLKEAMRHSWIVEGE